MTKVLWGGVVMIERTPDKKQNVRVMSARRVELNGLRAIDCRLPYAMVAHYFDSTDGDHVFVEAEYFSNEYLQLYGRAVAGLKSWVENALTDQQKLAGETNAYIQRRTV